MKKFTVVIILISFIWGTVLTPAAQAVVPVLDSAAVAALGKLVTAEKLENIILGKDLAQDTAKFTFEKAIATFMKIALEQLKRKLLTNVVNQIFAWVSSGFKGKPRFVTDWKAFLKDSAIEAGQETANKLLTLATVCFPYQKQFRDTIANETKTKPLAELDCSVFGITNPLFFTNFNVGGYTGYLQQALNGNYYAAVNSGIQEVLSNAQDKIQSSQNEGTSGKGYISNKVCKTIPETKENICNIIQPGSNIDEAVNKAFGVPLDYIVNQIVSADGVEAIISTAASILISITVNKLTSTGSLFR